VTANGGDADLTAVVSGGFAKDGHAPADAAEVAAVVAAISVFTAGGDSGADAHVTPRWRFSGRWWSKPQPARRERP
jgi:hypothetical protein